MILTGGTILTMDQYLAPTEAMAIVDGRILAVGHENEILPLANWKTKHIDLNGAVVVPGLTDCHFDLLGFGRSLEGLQLRGTTSAAEIAALVATAARDSLAGTWITGYGWDQNDWQVNTLPTHAVLDKAAPNHPVILTRIDGNAIWVNGRALTLVRITSSTPDPDGGVIIRDKDGNPTGVLIGKAMELVTNKLPELREQDIRHWLLAAVQRCNQVGLTGIHDPGVHGTTLDIIRDLVDEGLFTLRYYGMLDGEDEELLEQYFGDGPLLNYGGYLTVRATSFPTDGTLGTRTAALLSPYSDDPGNLGLLVIPSEKLEGLVSRSLLAGFQPCIHAVGDRANRLALDIYEQVLDQYQGEDIRPRIEEAQVLSRSDIRRFTSLGVLPVMLPGRSPSDMDWIEDRLGTQRVSNAYVWRSLLNTGTIIPGGSGCPAELEEPLLQIYAARTRQDTSGQPLGGWYSEERMTGMEALRAMTTWAAYAAFEDSTRGKILPGFDADLTVLSLNPVISEPQALLNAEVLMTIIAGRIVWQDKEGLRALGDLTAGNTTAPPATATPDNN